MLLLFLLIKLFSNVRIKPARRRRTITTRTVTKTVYTLGTKTGPARTVQRDAEKRRRDEFKRSQAAADYVHYTQVKRDLMTAYNASGAASGDSEKAIRKRIAYDNAIRTVEKKIEKAVFDSRRTG